MTPNWQQAESALRTLIAVFGGIAIGRGWITADQLQLLGSPEVWAAIGTLVSFGVAAWGMFAHSKTNAVAVVAAMPEVAKVETTATPEGKALAENVGTKPDAVVTVAPK